MLRLLILHNYFFKFMLSNRTHHLQEQLTTSIIDTGVDLKQLDHN